MDREQATPAPTVPFQIVDDASIAPRAEHVQIVTLGSEQTVLAPATPSQTVDDAPQAEHVQIVTSGSVNSSGVSAVTRTQASTTERPLLNPGSTQSLDNNPYTDFERVPAPRFGRSRDGHVRLPSRRTLASTGGLPVAPLSSSGLDWIVPVNEKSNGTRRTIGERLQPTIDNAVIERDKYAVKSLWTGYALNIAIGLQVLLGALTTALAAALTTGKQGQVATSVLGGLSTLVASYLARARGSGEPELSITRVKDLEQFLRECRAFQIDHAHEYGTPENRLGEQLDNLRRRFEELLGNGNGVRKLSPVGITATQAV